MLCCLSYEVLSPIFPSPLTLPMVLSSLIFLSVMGACLFSFVWGFMAGLHCRPSDGGIISN